jgi:hypothetical protein
MKGVNNMKTKTKYFKKAICFIAVIALMLSSSAFTASAADRTKTVSYSTSYDFSISPSQLSDYMNSPAAYIPATYYYNDGVYKGTLSLTYAACSAPVYVDGYLKVTIFATYSGTVTAPPLSKTVTYNTSYPFTISPSQFPDYMSSPSSYVPSTYYYSDGTYSSTLNLTYAACSAPTPVGNYLQVTIYTTYSGTVYSR